MKEPERVVGLFSESDVVEHRLLGRTPDFARDYGLWIISAMAIAGTDLEPQAAAATLDCFDKCHKRKFEFYSLSHLVRGRGRIWTTELGETDILPNQAVLIVPGELNRYGGCYGKPYIEDAVCFCGPIADTLYKSGILQSGVFEFGSARRLRPLAERFADPSLTSQLTAAIELQKILTDICLERRKGTTAPAIEKALELIKSQIDHWWQVRELAEYCNCSPAQFRREFVHRTGMLPKHYIEELKLRQAADLLANTRIPVRDIAEHFGYRDPYHFSRRFKIFSGAAPEVYRRGSHRAF